MNEQKLPENGTVLESVAFATQKHLFKMNKIDLIFTIPFLFLGWAYYKLFFRIIGTGIPMLAFTLLFVVIISIYADKKGKKASKESYIWLATLLALAFSKVLFVNNMLQFVSSIALHLLAVYWTMSRTDALIEGQLGKWVWLEGIRGLFYHCFRCFFALIIAMKRGLFNFVKQKNLKSSFKEIVIGILILAVMLAVIIPSLNVASEGLFQNFIYMFRTSGIFVMNVLAAFLFGSFFYGLAYSCAGFDHNSFNQKCLETQAKAKKLPVNSIKIAYYGVSAVFVLFVLNSIRVTTAASMIGLSKGYSYAQYARAGFFEMVWVATFSLLAIAVTVSTSRESWYESIHLRVSASIFSICTIGLVGTALAKMSMYISAYGLTPLRFFTTIFMLFLLLVFGLIIASVKYKINVPRIGGIVFCMGFLLINLINTPGLITAYNTNRFINSTLPNQTIEDINYYSSSDEVSSQLTLYHWLQEGSTEKKRMGASLYERHRVIENGSDLFSLTLSEVYAYYKTSGFERYAV